MQLEECSKQHLMRCLLIVILNAVKFELSGLAAHLNQADECWEEESHK